MTDPALGFVFGSVLHKLQFRGLSFSSEEGFRICWGVHKFLKRKIGGGHKIFDDQNLESHKMTTDIVFILFKKTDFNTILACLEVMSIGDGGGVIKYLLSK